MPDRPPRDTGSREPASREGVSPEPASRVPGRRVSLRQRLPRRAPGAGGPDRYTDAVGQLTAGAGGLVVIRPDGTRAPVRQERVVAVRDVPPAAGGRDRPGSSHGADPASLDRLAAAHWPATTIAALGDWQLRAAGGFTRRANSALATGDPGLTPSDALAGVKRWYRERGLPALVSTANPALIEVAVAAGWRTEQRTEVLTARVADVLGGLEDGWASAAPGLADPPVVLTSSPDDAWLADYRDADAHPHGPAVVRAPPGTIGLFATVRVAAAAATPGGLPGRGRAVVSDGWVGVSCVAVAPGLRRRGVGRLVVGWLLDAALDAGAIRAYLQVCSENQPALACYQALGFTLAHRTTYLAA